MQIIKEFKGDYRFLSNFWPCKIIFDGIEYASSEAAYQAQKTTDINLRREMAALPPGQSKRAGQNLILRDDWDKIRYLVMYEILECKFAQNPEFLSQLKETKTAYLQEGNNWGDVYWGVDLKSGRGANNLGILLMHLRSKL